MTVVTVRRVVGGGSSEGARKVAEADATSSGSCVLAVPVPVPVSPAPAPPALDEEGRVTVVGCAGVPDRAGLAPPLGMMDAPDVAVAVAGEVGAGVGDMVAGCGSGSVAVVVSPREDGLSVARMEVLEPVVALALALVMLGAVEPVRRVVLVMLVVLVLEVVTMVVLAVVLAAVVLYAALGVSAGGVVG